MTCSQMLSPLLRRLCGNTPDTTASLSPRESVYELHDTVCHTDQRCSSAAQRCLLTKSCPLTEIIHYRTGSIIPWLVYFLPQFWRPFLNFQWHTSWKFCPYVWLVFKTGLQCCWYGMHLADIMSLVVVWQC
jgi:hypothetical protein